MSDASKVCEVRGCSAPVVSKQPRCRRCAACRAKYRERSLVRLNAQLERRKPTGVVGVFVAAPTPGTVRLPEELDYIVVWNGGPGLSGHMGGSTLSGSRLGKSVS